MPTDVWVLCTCVLLHVAYIYAEYKGPLDSELESQKPV